MKIKIKQKILKVLAICILFLGNSHLIAQSLPSSLITQTACIGVEDYEIVPNPNSTYTWSIIDQGTGLTPPVGEADITYVTTDSYINVTYTIAGIYELSVFEQDIAGCQSTIAVLK